MESKSTNVREIDKKQINMKKIDQKLDQWIHNSIIRTEVRKVIEDYILDQKVDAFKAGWAKGSTMVAREIINSK